MCLYTYNLYSKLVYKNELWLLIFQAQMDFPRIINYLGLLVTLFELFSFFLRHTTSKIQIHTFLNSKTPIYPSNMRQPGRKKETLIKLGTWQGELIVYDFTVATAYLTFIYEKQFNKNIWAGILRGPNKNGFISTFEVIFLATFIFSPQTSDWFDLYHVHQ